jgi:hypothetical protein
MWLPGKTTLPSILSAGSCWQSYMPDSRSTRATGCWSRPSPFHPRWQDRNYRIKISSTKSTIRRRLAILLFSILFIAHNLSSLVRGGHVTLLTRAINSFFFLCILDFQVVIESRVSSNNVAVVLIWKCAFFFLIGKLLNRIIQFMGGLKFKTNDSTTIKK